MEVLDLIDRIPESPEKLRSQVQRFNREMSLSAISIWENKYEQALMGLEYRLTRLDKLNEALLVKIEIKILKKKLVLGETEMVMVRFFQKSKEDFALKSNGASAKAERFAELLIDGKTKHSKFSGFAWGNYPTDFQVVFTKTTRIGGNKLFALGGK